MKSSDDSILALDELMPRNVGEIGPVFHEEQSTRELHIDVYHTRSRGEGALQCLFTAGMRKPMNPVPKYSNEKYAALMMCLPAEWELTTETLRNESNY